MKKIFLIIIFIDMMATASFAQDRVFAYAYQTNVLNKGDFDLELHNTLSTGKVGAYSPYLFGQHLDQRLEFEVGLGRKVQTAFYIISELFNYADTSSTALNQDLKVFCSNEWKWKLFDPVANRIGFTLYEELEFGGNNFESETKLIFDKRWRKDLIAFNIVGKYEIEREISRIDNVTRAEWTSNSPVEFNLGYMHFFKPEIGFGLEVRNNNDITKVDGWLNSVLFAGAAFHATIGKFFTSITALPQIVNLHRSKSALGNRDLNDFEQVEVKVLVGYSF